MTEIIHFDGKLQDYITAREKGITSERERIVELLEKDICTDWTLTCCDGACRAYKDAVALIRGENK